MNDFYSNAELEGTIYTAEWEDSQVERIEASMFKMTEDGLLDDNFLCVNVRAILGVSRFVTSDKNGFICYEDKNGNQVQIYEAGENGEQRLTEEFISKLRDRLRQVATTMAAISRARVAEVCPDIVSSHQIDRAALTPQIGHSVAGWRVCDVKDGGVVVFNNQHPSAVTLSLWDWAMFVYQNPSDQVSAKAQPFSCLATGAPRFPGLELVSDNGALYEYDRRNSDLNTFTLDAA